MSIDSKEDSKVQTLFNRVNDLSSRVKKLEKTVKEDVQFQDLDQFLSLLEEEDFDILSLLFDYDENEKELQISLKDMSKVLRISKLSSIQEIFEKMGLKGYKVDKILEYIKQEIDRLQIDK